MVESPARWDKLSEHYPPAVKEIIKTVMTFDFDVHAFLGQDKISTVCSAALSQGHTKKTIFNTSDDFGLIFPKFKQKFLVDSYSKHLLPISVMSYLEIGGIL